VPLVADVHHNGMKIALEVAKHVDNVRINPGLYVFEKPQTIAPNTPRPNLKKLATKFVKP
jgi:(E)-4-hydroxy-3-methylbut-2-enyl-diphosphate synthase